MRKWIIYTTIAVAGLASRFCAPQPVWAQTVDALPSVQFISQEGTFPITAVISRVVVGTDGLDVQFDKRDGPNRWSDTPDFSGVGGMGPLEYSIGLALQVNGQWVASAPIEFWNGRPPQGTGQIQDQTVTCPTGTGQIHCNWFYDSGRWPHLFDARPQPGETIGVYVVAGDVRNNIFVVRERSAIVRVVLPNTGVAAVFDYPAQGTGPVLPPAPPTTDPGTSPLPPSTDDAVLLAIQAHLADLESRVATLEEDNTAQAEKLAQQDGRLTALEARPIVTACAASVLGIPVHCAVK